MALELKIKLSSLPSLVESKLIKHPTPIIHRFRRTDGDVCVGEDVTEPVCSIMRGLRLALLLVPLTLLVLECQSFELQDTIHALIEENIHLHDQLENLTQALRELKRMLWQHGNDPELHEHDEVVQHLWDEWSQLGIGAETHLLLEHIFCGQDVIDSAATLHERTALLLLVFLCFTVLLLSCS